MTKTRKETAELSSAAKNKKLSTPPPRPQLSFPCIRGSIHPHAPDAAFGNVLTATDNDESETNSNTDNEVPKTSHGARYPMGPRVREDDKNKKRKSRAKAAKNKKLSTPPPRPQLSFPRMRGSIHPHAPEPAFGNVLTATDNNESETSSNNEARKTSHGARYTMGPRVREDDKNKKRKSRAKFSGKEQKTQHTAATPPTVIPAHAGIHSSARARSRVWKCTCRNKQRRKRSQQQHG
ncbi:hypothetical protein M2G93_13165 [Vibrio vulnificus]|nr:hypothetical protein [Vibrio vulnificus]